MDPTTLVTFLFKAPPEVRTVELLGSWDNFELPYRMHHDRQRGRGLWSGCFKFENIIFDGDRLDWAKPRSGGLKQGGTYWYYYRLDYENEAYDERQPATTGCPLLPGQKVNIMEVPIELEERPTRVRSACGYADIAGSLTQLAQQKTLEPSNKYAVVEAPPKSKIHLRCLSDEALDGRLEGQPLIVVENTASPVSTPQSRRARSVSLSSQQGSVRVRREDVLSDASSVYSEHSHQSVCAMSTISEMSAPIMKNNLAQAEEANDEGEDGDLPSFPYPSALGAAPLASLEALGAALFASSSDPAPRPALPERLPPPPPVPETSSMPADADRRASMYTCGPESAQNVQFYGSRPSSASSLKEEYRPRMYSLPNLQISDRDDDSPPASPASPGSPGLEYSSRRPSEDDDENPTPDDTGAFDLMSPTFTATTVSSAGNNSPFRLSTHESYNNDSHVSIGDEQDPTESDGRLHFLDTSRNQSVTSQPSMLERTLARPSPPSFLNYSLPSLANESNHSLAKTVSNPSARVHSSRLELPMPSVFHQEEESSMAEDIFSELGYLSNTIN